MYKNGDKKIHMLKTFRRSNHDMIIHQKPLVSHGQKVKKGDVLVDGHSVDKGELAI
jgi:DNA-directed RNA polymerase subunit beta